MIVLFLRQHASWLLLIVGLHIILNVLLYVDAGIEDVSFYYFNAVWLFFVFLFCLIRFTLDYRLLSRFPERKTNYYRTIENDYIQQLEQLKIEQRQQNLQLLEKQDELLAWVHEMKAPLTAMQLLHDNVENSVLKERLNNEWLRLYLLLDTQLHATRLMAIEQDNRLQQVDIREIVVKEVKEMRSWFFEKKIALDMDAVEGEVISDSKWLGFIVRQLLTNALKYSEPGQEIRVYTTESNGNKYLHIQDFGQGIAAEDLPRIFRKAYTGTLGRETSSATGMGLYLVKQAADALHMKVSITSKLGEGTTVHLQFAQMNEYEKTFSM